VRRVSAPRREAHAFGWCRTLWHSGTGRKEQMRHSLAGHCRLFGREDDRIRSLAGLEKP
jgi:hypothetical protein